MSILLMSKVFATGLRPSKKIVLLSLADFASDDGKNVYPSVETVAEKSSLSTRSVQTIIGGFLKSGLLLVMKNPFGGAPGTTRHLAINLIKLENLMRLETDENFAPVQETANDSGGGVQMDDKTGATPAPKPSKNHHKTTTTDEPPESCGGETQEFEWPPQLDAEERDAIQAVFSFISKSNQQKQFALDELRAALTRREILRKASWVRKVLEKGLERTPAGKAYDRTRRERVELKNFQSQKPSEPKKEVDQNAGREQFQNWKKRQHLQSG
jgi:hypothetical protein